MMGKLTRIASLLMALVLLSACGGKKAAPAQSVREFPPVPKVPSVFTDPADINGYVADHFWDEFLSKPYTCDSLLVNGVQADEVESALGRFVTIIENYCTRDRATAAMQKLFDKVSAFQVSNPSSNVFAFFEKMVPKYLYDPNSPVRDEDLYLPYVTGLSSSDLASEDMKPSYSRDASVCSINKVGTKAADIVFTDMHSKRHRLYDIKTDHTLLFFSNPGCNNCEEVTTRLSLNGRVQELIDSKELAIVNIYIDQEREKWMAAAGGYPGKWYNGYDQDYVIRRDLTYCVRAIPSLYILDKDKVVLMKDAPVEKVLVYLENI